MAHKKGTRKTLVTTLSVLIVLLVAIGTVSLFKVLGSGKNNPYTQQNTASNEAASNDNAETKPSDDTDASSSQPAEQTQIDPATVNTVDISPMEITVSYVKGVGGFEYEVLRAANGTRYVEFRSPTLVGTKCTNDTGTFVSIIASPTDSESTGLAKTTTVDGVKYGLALADASCTNQATELEKYQKSFSDAFSLLKKIQ